MKQIIKSIILSLLAIFPITVYAESGIEKFYINAVVEENGDLTVEEYFYLNGEFNGMEREILYQNDDLYDFHPELDYYGGSKLHNGSGIELLEIRALPIDENFDFKNISGSEFEEVSSADKGDYGVYTVDTSSNGEAYQIYLPDNKNKAFYIKYRLKNMAIIHNDIAEIYWNAIGDSLSESIGTLRITVTFPGNENEFRVWAHGPLNGKINKVSNQELVAEVTNVYSYEAVDIRAVFDKSVIPSSTKKTNVDALAKILNYEEDAANQANYEREQEEYQNQQTAYEELAYCNRYPTRSCYNNAKYYISLVTDETVFKDLQTKLEELHVLVIEKEEKTAKEDVKLALEYRDYYWYNEAIKSVKLLENRELKSELLAKLVPVKQEIIEKEEKFNETATIISCLIIVCLIGTGIYLYFKCDKEYNVQFDHKYMRDFPNDFSPATVEYLMKKKITEESISSEILYLIYMKKIKATKDEEKKDILLEKNGLKLDHENDLEKALINLIFRSKSKIWLKDLKKTAQTSTSFYKDYQKVNKIMLNIALNEHLYEEDKTKVDSKSRKKTSWKGIVSVIILLATASIGFLAFILALIIILCWNKNTISYKLKEKNSLSYRIKKNSRFVATLAMIYAVVGIIHLFATKHFVYDAGLFYLYVLIVAIILIIYSVIARKRTEKGALEYKKWRAFKQFLKDFGSMDEKTLPEIILWEKYLVYAVVLGCANKLSKTMKIKLEDMNVDYNFSFDPITFTNLSIISHAVSTSIHSARTYNSSSGSSNWSSGSGGGGGFSSGGGFGGGGGGGGRF